MKKQTNFKITISGGIYKDFKTNPDGSITISMEIHGDTQPIVVKESGITFVGIPIHTVTPLDDFMYYVPTTKDQIDLKKKIERVFAEKSIADFFIPFDYTQVKLFNLSFGSLGYSTESCNSWIASAKKDGCNLLTFSQYIMLLAWMLKTLTEKENWDNQKAWIAIAENSELLNDLNWEKTFGFLNFLSGTKKLLLPDDPSSNGCYMAGGGRNGNGWNYPLGQIIDDPRRDISFENHPYRCYGFICK